VVETPERNGREFDQRDECENNAYIANQVRDAAALLEFFILFFGLIVSYLCQVDVFCIISY
jgi:hypothetical protein